MGQPSFSMIVGDFITRYYGLVKVEDFKIPKRNIVDLRYIFKDNSDTLYKDQCCHLNKKGMNILASKISNELIKLIESK